MNNLLQSSNTVEDEFIEMMDSFHSFEINHEITYNKNGILSILYSIYICSGNCDYTQLPIVYSLDNGKKLKTEQTSVGTHAVWNIHLFLLS